MTTPDTILAGKVVSIHYKLTLDDGRVVDSSEGRTPLDYLHGSHNIVPGLESALEGRTVGESVAVVVAPEDGYGERDEAAIHTVARAAFPADANLQAGMSFQAQDEHRNPLLGTILAIENEQVTVDFNHPLAGQRLHFDVSIEAVRDASHEERAHGHVHGEGHAH